METLPSLLNPERFIEQKAIEVISNEIDIAAEVFLANQCSCLHYEDLMGNIESGLASKEMLIAWLNDNTRHGKIVRQGVINTYLKECPDDFDTYGFWKPNRFPHLVYYVAIKLTDKNFVNSKEKAKIFNSSFIDMKWVSRASLVIGLKMLEKMHEMDSLKSIVARSIIESNIASRDLLGDAARVITRSVRNAQGPEEIGEQLKELMESRFRSSVKQLISRFEQHEEYRLFRKYRGKIAESLNEIPDRIKGRNDVITLKAIN